MDSLSENNADETRRAFFHSVGQVATVLSINPDYHHLPISSLMSLVVEPLSRGRLFVASPHADQARAQMPGGLSGILLTARTSRSVDRKIRRQIERDQFPLTLQAADWDSGSINWILDIIAPDAEGAAAILSKYMASLADQPIRLHPKVQGKLGSAIMSQLGLEKIETRTLN